MKTIKTLRLTLLANRSLLACLAFLILPGTTSSTGGSEADVQVRFVGSLACRECHPEEYENFMTYAKKSSLLAPYFQGGHKNERNRYPENTPLPRRN